MGNVFRGDGKNRRAVRSPVVLPLAAQNDLKVRNRVAGDLPTYTVKSQIRDVVLPATVEAATYFDMQIADRFIGLEAGLAHALTQLACEPARGRNAEFAGVCARAGNNIDQRPGARVAQTRRHQRAIEFR